MDEREEGVICPYAKMSNHPRTWCKCREASRGARKKRLGSKGCEKTGWAGGKKKTGEGETTAAEIHKPGEKNGLPSHPQQTQAKGGKNIVALKQLGHEKGTSASG